MEKGWTLHVEDFGPIERADVTLSPLTFFVGDNNSGKSYLMALLYGLARADTIISNLCVDSQEYKICGEWMRAVVERMKKEDRQLSVTDYTMTFENVLRLDFGEDAYEIFENLLDRILVTNRTDIMESIFQEDLSAEKIQIRFQRTGYETITIGFFETLLYLEFSFTNTPVYLRNDDFLSNSAIHSLVAVTLSSLLISGIFSYSGFGAYFLPTARTGFMLSYPALVQDAFSRAYRQPRGTAPGLTLTMPCTDFLSSLATLFRRQQKTKVQNRL